MLDFKTNSACSATIGTEYTYDAGDGRNESAAGMYYTKDSNADAINTIFQMRKARYVLPSIDHPALKAHLKLCITAPSKCTAYGYIQRFLAVFLANFALFAGTSKQSQSPERNGSRTTTCFKPTPPLPTYLFTFALLRNYDKIAKDVKIGKENVTIQTLFPRGAVSKSRLQWINDEAAKRLKRQAFL